ncbi:Chromosome partition protein Smc [Streptomyces alboniger]
MITQIRIDGFKSFLDFSLDVPPTLVMLGPNGAGKSNLFDALRLVAAAARGDFQQMVAKDPRLVPSALFHRTGRDGVRHGSHLTLSVGAVVPSPEGPLPIRVSLLVQDANGASGRSRALDYSCAVRLDSSSGLGETAQRAREAFTARTGVATGTVLGSGGDLLWGGPDADDLTPRAFDELERSTEAGRAELRRLTVKECASWYPLTLDPAAMRHPVPSLGKAVLGTDGSELAAVLDQIAQREPRSWRRLVADLAALVDGVDDVRTIYDERRQEVDFEVAFSHTGWCTPPLLSDGTLRTLGLLAAASAPDRGDVLCVEEIENGMYPERVADLVRRLRRGTGVDPEHPGGPYGQLIATTHSPALLAALRDDLSGSLVFLEPADRVDPEAGTISRTTVARPLLARSTDSEPGQSVSPAQVDRLLRRLGQGAA